ncbi:DUF2851 family protein [Bacteroidia bacterium]|nr:DUF2851 family protein [Bacteroidia bacterium]
MLEKDIHIFWESKCLGCNEFKTTDGEIVIIKDFGIINNGQGPDFSNAHIQINGLDLYGAVEIHIETKDWYRHGHEIDKRYDQVILHVVWKSNSTVRVLNKKIPEIQLSDYFSENDLQKTKTNRFVDFPCMTAYNEKEISQKITNQQLALASILHLNQKVGQYLNEIKRLEFDWDQLLFKNLLCYALDPQNRSNAELLFPDLKLSILRRYPFHQALRALVVESGLYEQTPVHIRNSFDYLGERKNTKYVPLYFDHEFKWKHGRVRPSAYPLVRLNLVLSWLNEYDFYFDEFWNADLRFLIEDIKRYSLSKGVLVTLIQNVILPLRMAKARLSGLNEDIDLSQIEILRYLPFENNHITRKMKSLFQLKQPSKAIDSLALLSQHKQFCQSKQCTTCLVGKAIWF